MLILVSSASAFHESKVDERFGRCAYFGLYDTRTCSFEFVKNSSVNESQGAGIAAAQKAIHLKAQVVLTGNLGPKALKVLNGAGIKSYTAKSINVLDAVAAYQEHKLPEITAPSRV